MMHDPVSSLSYKRLDISQLAAEVDRLPELPQAVVGVMRALEEPDVDADDLASIIRLDPNLTAQILRLSNSAAYGLSRRVETVKDAVAILGQNTLKSLLYTILSHQALTKEMPGYALKAGDLWSHAMSGAFYARHMSKNLHLLSLTRAVKIDPEVVFTAALLRDIGKIILAVYVGANYSDIDHFALKHQVSFQQAERHVIGASHTDVGEAIAERWQLPQSILRAIAYHHTPLNAPKSHNPQDELVLALVHLADGIATLLGKGVGCDGLMYQIDYNALNAAGITLEKEHFEKLIAELMTIQPQLDDMLSTMKA
jgi:putative nucleotidyltransferase with HDIG domain